MNSTKRQINQAILNVIALVFFAVILILPAVMAYTFTVYLNDTVGLLPLVAYWYVYDVITGYFA